MTTMEFFYFANDAAERIRSMEDIFYGEELLNNEMFTRPQNLSILDLEYMVSIHLLDIAGIDYDIDDWESDMSEISNQILSAESEEEIDKIVADYLKENSSK